MTGTETAAAATDTPAAARRSAGAKTVAAIFVLPYLLMMLAWAFSNPAGAAPDEPDHLVKALGMARLDIGSAYPKPPADQRLISIRNASISRVVAIPSRLSPAGYACEAFKPDRSAACLPTKRPSGSGRRDVATALGSYPPFLYVPIGFAAALTATPYHAFVAARLVCGLMSAVLIWLGCAHLERWLGRTALFGAVIALTPMTVFVSATVSLSGVEIAGALAVAAIAVTAIRRPESLQEGGTQLLLAGVGAALILSRQLGAVTFGAVIVLLVCRLGWRFFWDLIKAHRPAFVSAAVIPIVAVAAVATWESRYDHPALTGRPVSGAALGVFSQQAYGIVHSAIGQFGWLDTNMPRWSYAAYLVLLVLLVGLAVLVGSRADRWSLAGWLVATVLLAYVTYATVFFPIAAGLQGRHMLPFFMMVPVLAGVVVAERFGTAAPSAMRRFVGIAAVVMPALQFVGLYLNARRYAVGANGPMLFFGKSQWHPYLGWAPWLVLGALGAAGLVVVTAGIRPPRIHGPREAVPSVDG
ncbi:MAG: hypothetical protein DLM57_05345 [Pseudonocardiales bacterium]|nr:MAG: hypothetical protein DLM57_05345 [Pseudonocardiales bacterium]